MYQDDFLSEKHFFCIGKYIFQPNIPESNNVIGWPDTLSWVAGVGGSDINSVSPLNPGSAFIYNFIFNINILLLMQIIIHRNNNNKAAEIISDDIVINKVKDALELMVNVDYLGSRQIILHSKNITPGFFQLKTGLAGEILQKYVNYKIKLAIIGDFSIYDSNSLQAFIKECNRNGQFFFLNDIEMAKAKFLQYEL